MAESTAKIADVAPEVEKVEAVPSVAPEAAPASPPKSEELTTEKPAVDEPASTFYSLLAFNIIIFCEVSKIYVVLGEESRVFVLAEMRDSLHLDYIEQHYHPKY